jgi:hypothetical protein
MEDKWIIIKHVSGEELLHINTLSRVSRTSATKITFYSGGNIITGLELTFSNTTDAANVIRSIDSRMDPNSIPPLPPP